jgi:hypothetical protein
VLAAWPPRGQRRFRGCSSGRNRPVARLRRDSTPGFASGRKQRTPVVFNVPVSLVGWFKSRWGRHLARFQPTISIVSATRRRCRKLVGKSFDRSVEEPDAKRAHRFTERRPRRCVVDRDDVAAGAVRAALQEVAARAVCQRQANEGPAQVVPMRWRRPRVALLGRTLARDPDRPASG